ncbi:hypothetical protein GCM10009789_37370 [Kribbella sancticallisti]|uniref:Exo-alpha-sialidase n=2 Tax=Kribbella sancticallisti TaxID=460087 RepID=A0ABN2DP53_9ACTN
MARSTPPARKTRKSPAKVAVTPPTGPGLGTRGWLTISSVLVFAVILSIVLPRVIGNGGGQAGADGGDPGVAHVHGLGIDPADSTLYAATHFGVFRIPASGPATRIADRYQDTMGFTVVGPRHFLGSGHPDERENKPGRLGLIESTDAGQTWRALSLEGEADFHALKAAHGQVYGFDSGTARFMVTTDRRTWQTRSITPMIDFAVSPAGPDTILATTQEYGLARSTDGGRSFAPVKDAPPVVVLAWQAPDVLYGVTITGAVMASHDAGGSWQQQGSLDGRPEALVAESKDKIYAATESGIYASTDGGRTFTLRYRG